MGGWKTQLSAVPASPVSDAGGASDHLATIKAFNQWKGAQTVGVCVCTRRL